MLQDWRSIRTIEALREFRKAYQACSAAEKKKILEEMAELLGDYAKTVVVEREKPPQAEKPLTRPRRVRNGRVSRRG